MRTLRQSLVTTEGKPKIKTAGYIAVLIVIAVATHLQWFNPFSILQFGDWQYRPDEHVRQLLASWNAWVPFNGLGEANILISGFPFRGIAWSTITSMGFAYDIATKVTLFWPVAIGAFLSPFLLGVYLFKDRFVAFIAALFYGSTAYFLILQTTHLPIAIIYVLLPILVYWLHRALKENATYLWVLLGLGFCVGIFYEVRIMYIVSFILAGYFMWYLWAYRPPIKQYIKPLLITGALVILGNLFWLLPTKMIGGDSIGEVASRGLFGDTLFNLSQSFTIMKWSWTGEMVDTNFVAQAVPIYFWLAPIVAFAGLAFVRVFKKNILFFLVVTLVGLLLTKQSAEPFASVYEWLYAHFPGFVLFREASKFYLLVAFGYFGLICCALLGLKSKAKEAVPRLNLWRLGYGVAALAIIVFAGLNFKPAFLMELGGTFKNSEMPNDYKKLKEFIIAQPDYFRTYWVPRESWWGYYDNLHPKVRGTDMIEKAWKPFVESPGGDSYGIAKNNIDIFNLPVSPLLFSSASIKYVIVPLRDSQDDFFPSYGDDPHYFVSELGKVDFLKRIDIGTQDIAVFENQKFSPYITTSADIVEATSGSNQREQAGFIASKLGGNFTLPSKKTPGNSSNKLFTLFEPSSSQVADKEVLSKVDAFKGGTLFVNPNMQQVNYVLNNGNIEFWRAAESDLTLDDALIAKGEPEQRLASARYDERATYYVAEGDDILPFTSSSVPSTLGSGDKDIALFATNSGNLIPNPSFEQGLWEEKVRDCNHYNDQPQIAMQQNNTATDGEKSLQLSAFKHIACTGQAGIPVNAGDSLLFGFDVRSDEAPKAGFKLAFNDPKHTVIEDGLPLKDGDWRTVSRLITVPAGATQMSLEAYGYPNLNKRVYAHNFYDNFKLIHLREIVAIPASNIPEQQLPLPAGQEFAYVNGGAKPQNLIQNASFEQGLWQQKVGDCNNYDNRPVIGMRQSPVASEGRQSLALSAKRHIACTGNGPVAISGNTDYLFSFDTRAANTQEASYSIRFNDPLKSVVSGKVALDKKDWQSYSTIVHTPAGATEMRITVYAVPETGDLREVVVNYDNFRLLLMPHIISKYHVLAGEGQSIASAPAVNYVVRHPTNKSVNITGVQAPFYLMMNEAYHDKWALVANNANTVGSLLPFGIKSIEAPHVAVNGTMNAWYIDPQKLCSTKNDICSKAPDGSYNLAMVIEFTPQRWFYVGAIISGVAFTVSISYLALRPVIAHRQKKSKKTARADLHVDRPDGVSFVVRKPAQRRVLGPHGQTHSPTPQRQKRRLIQ